MGRTLPELRAYQQAARLLEPGAMKDALDIELRSSLAHSCLREGETREKLCGCVDALAWYRKSDEQWTALSKQQGAAAERQATCRAGWTSRPALLLPFPALGPLIKVDATLRAS